MRQRTRWDWKLKVLPFVAAALAVAVWIKPNVAAQVGGDNTSASTKQANSQASRSPNGSPASAAPSTVLGLTRDGQAYVLVRDLPCRPKCSKPLVTEFTVMFTEERR